LLKRQKDNIDQQNKTRRVQKPIEPKSSSLREDFKGGIANAKIDFLGLSKMKELK
jgi:hypothetical protein